MNPLLQPINRFEGRTEHDPRPSRQLAQYRYLDEGELTRLCDEWDESENLRRHWAVEGARVERAMNERKAAEEKAKREREDALLDDELKRRYLSGGGTEAGFIVNRQKIRSEFAMQVAIGAAQPVMGSVDQLKAELKALRGHRLAMPDSAEASMTCVANVDG
jgi:hypothetical protein